MMKSYSGMLKLKTFEERLLYLKTRGKIGSATFGPERELNQRFYKSREWKLLRDSIIVRDAGCDLAVPGLEILDRIHIHHINPITIDDFANKTNKLLDPDNMVCVSIKTHELIHYGNTQTSGLITRIQNDTRLW